MKQSPNRSFAKSPLATGITFALFSALSNTSVASNFQLGDFDIRFDSTFSIGAIVL